MVLGGWGLGEQVDQIQNHRYTWQVLDYWVLSPALGKQFPSWAIELFSMYHSHKWYHSHFNQGFLHELPVVFFFNPRGRSGGSKGRHDLKAHDTYC